MIVRPKDEKSARKGHVGYNLVACGKNGFDQRTTVFDVPITVNPSSRLSHSQQPSRRVSNGVRQIYGRMCHTAEHEQS